MKSRDTSAEAHAVWVSALRGLGGARRVELAFEMSRQANEIALAGLRTRRPELSRKQAEAHLRRQLLGEDLYGRAYEQDRS